MTTVDLQHPNEVTATEYIADDEFVVPERLTKHAGVRGPRFGDDVWDFRAFVPRTTVNTRCDFTTLPDAIAARTIKEYLYSLIRNRGIGTGPAVARPTKLTSVADEFTKVRFVLKTFRQVGAARLAEVEKEHFDAAVRQWSATSAARTADFIAVVQRLSRHGASLTADRLDLQRWLGRTSHAMAGFTSKGRDWENTTPRIPEHILAPLVKAALFYVGTASMDITAAQQKLLSLRDNLQLCGKGEAHQRLKDFIAQRRAQGRGMPAPTDLQRHRDGIEIVDGVWQMPSLGLTCLLAGIRGHSSHQSTIAAAGDELGYEPGSLETPITVWPDSGRPWRRGFDATGLVNEIWHLRTACWIVIAYLSGMRDQEVRELGRECSFVETGLDGRLRHKLRGRVFKGRQLSGDDAQWVVLEPVHRAVEVLLRINDDPGHLFGYYYGKNAGFVLLSNMQARMAEFRDHVNTLFSTPDGLFIPGHEVRKADADADEAPTIVPWAFTTRQFRRTLAWHIAHQPFGVVAGAKQYQHAKITMFEGYAGTSASGFAAEVAAEEAVSKLDYLEDLYRDWNDAGPASGGAAERIASEFERIRREMGDLPGIVASPSRLRTMLEHLTRILHPGVLNDCFYNEQTAVCAKRAKTLGRPLPLHNMCTACPNARRTTVHLPRLISARDQALQALADSNPVTLPPLQKVALTQHAASFDGLILELQHDAAATS